MWALSVQFCAIFVVVNSVHFPPLYPADGTFKIKDGDKFDFIVAGAGAAGCAVAYRLAEHGAKVALVEAGDDPDIRSRVPLLAQSLLGSNLDYRDYTLSNGKSCLSSQDRQCRYSRGKALGGGTAINYMMYVRGNRKGYDDWNIPGWAWNDIKQYFLKYENLLVADKLPKSSKPYHNTSGPMDIEFFADSKNAWHERILNGYQELNFPYNPDVNAETQIGVSHLLGFVNDDERESTARGYLARAILWENLVVLKNARVTSVIFDEVRNEAVGISVFLKGNKNIKIFASKEVILSMGTIATPQILMLSGIGPSKHLQEIGIPVKCNLPVGEGLVDHVLALVVLQIDRGFGINFPNLIPFVDDGVFLTKWYATNDGPMASNGLTDTTAFMNTNFYNLESSHLYINRSNPEFELPDVQMIHAYIDRDIIPTVESIFAKSTGLDQSTVDQLKQINVNYAFMVLSPVLLSPKSVGWVRLNSTDPLVAPIVFPNYLEQQTDVDTLVKAIRIIQDLVKTKPFKSYDAKITELQFEDCKMLAKDSDSYWDCYIRHMTSSVFHGMSTAAMGRVVDPELRVLGVGRLRVADGSVVPSLPRGNTAAACIAVGEKAADLLIQEHHLTGVPKVKKSKLAPAALGSLPSAVIPNLIK